MISTTQRSNSNNNNQIVKMRSMIISLILLCIFSFTFRTAYGQQYDFAKVMPPSPNASSLGKFGEVPVSNFTGSVNQTIPIYTVSSRSLNVNISLNYNSSGFKVAEDASWAGLGWALQAGGVITRSVRGKDDFENLQGLGYYFDSDTLPSEPDFNTIPYVQNFYDYSRYDGLTVDNVHKKLFKDIYTGLRDGEPDVFNYNFGDKTGKFFIDKEIRGGKVHVVERNSLRFKYDKETNRWIVTDTQGTNYFFGTVEFSYDYSASFPDQEISDETPFETSLNYYALAKMAPTSWYLDSVVSANKDIIRFEYYPSFYGGGSLSIANKSYKRYDVTSGPTGVITTGNNFPEPKSTYNGVTFSRQAIADVYLKKIIFPDGYVLFHTSPREDIEGKDSWVPQKVDRISVYDIKDNLLKSFELHQSYYLPAYPTASVTFDNKRLKLDSISIYGSTTKIARYKFDYFDANNLPSKYSKAIDQWGYYNGSTDHQSLLNPAVVPSVNNSQLYLTGGDRNPTTNIDFLTKGVLKSVSYPTGGKTLYDYELNDYRNGPPIYTTQGASALSDPDNSNTVPERTFSLTQTSIVNFSLLVAGQIVPSTTYGSLYSNGQFIRPFDVGQTAMSLSPGTYTIKVISTNVIVQLNASWPNPNPVYGNTIGGGLRIKRLTNFENSQVATVKKYFYTNESGLSSGLLIPKILTDQSNVEIPYFYCAFNQQSGAFEHNYFTWSFYLRSSASLLPLATFSKGYTIGYEQVTESLGENGEGGKTVYRYTSSPDRTAINPIPYLPYETSTSNGELNEQVTYDAQGNKVKSSRFFYDTKERYSVHGAKMNFSNFGYDPFVGPPSCTPMFVTTPHPSSWASKIRFFHNFSEWRVQIYQVDTVFAGQQHLITRQSMFYDNPSHKMLTKLESNNLSNGSDIIQTFKYAGDFQGLVSNPSDSDGKALKAMVQNNIIGQVVEKQTIVKRNGLSKIISGEFNRYKLWNTNNILPVEVYRLNLSQPSYDLLTSTYINNQGLVFNPNYQRVLQYNQYDFFGNVQSVNKDAGPPTTYVWDNNKLHLNAMVVNALSDECLAEDFESTPGAIQGGHTGKFSLNGSYTTADKISPGYRGRQYNISWWYKDGVIWKYSGLQPYTGQSLSGVLDDIRILPTDAQMTTYTYEPAIGVTSITDSKDLTTYYEYDIFQRLLNVKDNDKNIIKHYSYHYQK